MIRDNLFCIITGETGSGKSTQIAQYIINGLKRSDFKMPEEGKNDEDDAKDVRRSEKSPHVRVVVTQPRRVAAIQMAKRVAEERGGSKVGREVGYTIRFEDVSDPERTRIKYVTDGILVRECLEDPDLTAYSVVILDEAHERSLNTDILFALVKQAVLRRKGTLRLVITSATL